jgi:arylsulfatase A-like enzyme
MVDRRKFLTAVSFGAVNAALPASEQVSTPQTPAKPNVIVVISDQHRAGLTKRSGYPLNTSPAFDRFADGGVVFDQAYVTEPVCAPCRTSLLTGRWPHAHRVRQNIAVNDAFAIGDFFSVAKSIGYKTGITGKNHTYLKPDALDFWREYNDLVGWQPPNPLKEVVEFDEWRRMLNFAVSPVPTPFPVETQFSYRAVSSAIEFLEKFGGQPFVLEVSLPEPHDPEQVPKPYWDMFPPEQVPDRCAGPESLKNLGFQWQWMRQIQERYHPGYDGQWRRYVSNYLGSLRMVGD